tara:strand:+ start:629 stop:1078 length:450 start_codon:yes stop_codon:yes gene_type:complete
MKSKIGAVLVLAMFILSATPFASADTYQERTYNAKINRLSNSMTNLAEVLASPGYVEFDSYVESVANRLKAADVPEEKVNQFEQDAYEAATYLHKAQRELWQGLKELENGNPRGAIKHYRVAVKNLKDFKESITPVVKEFEKMKERVSQ